MPDLHDLPVSEYMYASVSVDRTDIHNEFARVSADLAYWGERFAQADRLVAEAKATLEEVHATLYAAQRDELQESTKSRPTKDLIEAHVHVSAEYKVAKQELRDREFARLSAKQVVDAVRVKGDMLVSLGAQMRAELGTRSHLNGDSAPQDWSWKEQ